MEDTFTIEEVKEMMGKLSVNHPITNEEVTSVIDNFIETRKIKKFLNDLKWFTKPIN